tara:strand:+ start:7820 stop:8467 length:648 start_codon:yes stop_codon:yes gene_type:complete
MKVCIIGFPRSRSSILLETISLFYKIPILGAPINDLDYRNLNSNLGINLLRNVLQKDQGIIRFHPMELMNKEDNYKIYNFDLLNFKQYNSIYVTYRESVSDIIASEIVARTFKKFTYKSQTELFEDIAPIKITDKHCNLIKEHVHSEKLVTNLKDYFKANRLEFTELPYDSIPLYISTNYPNTHTFHIETNYNYQKIITNYNEILPLYNQLKESI